MKKTSYIFLALLLAFSLSACGGEKNKTGVEQEKLKVAGTIFPLYDIVRTVGGEMIDAQLVLEPGSSPHTYEATPGKIKQMQGVKAFFMIGAGLDSWTENIAGSVQGAKLVLLEDYVDLKPFAEEHGHEDDDEHEDEHEDEDDHGHGDYDPHYWLDPEIAKVMAQKIAEELAGLDALNSDYYFDNANIFIRELEERAGLWREKLAGLADREILVFHDAWGYFASHFGLEIPAVFEPFPGKSPSPSYIIGLQKEIREHNIKTLFIEPQLSSDAMRTMAGDLKVEVAVLDPLGGVDGRESYIELMDYNVNAIYESLR